MLRKATADDLPALTALRCGAAKANPVDAAGWLQNVAGLENILVLEKNGQPAAMLAAVPVKYGQHRGVWLCGAAGVQGVPMDRLLPKIMEGCLRAYGASGFDFAVTTPDDARRAEDLKTLGFKSQLPLRVIQTPIRRDLFAHLQTLPLHYFDTNRKGDLMSLFTNDVDTISDALNNSFAVVIQTFIQVAGTLLLLFVLNWRLSLLVVVGYIAMFWYINYSTQRSRAFYARQQASLGELDAYMEEMIAGQKVVKVFNHQQADMAAFAACNEKLREAGTGAQSYAATMIPAVVSIGYLNYAVIAVVGGLMVMWGWSDLGSLASYLVFVRQTTLPINQLTQQGNFLLAALAGVERIFTVMEEKPEIDEGTVELVSVRENSDGTLTECAGSTGR